MASGNEVPAWSRCFCRRSSCSPDASFSAVGGSVIDFILGTFVTFMTKSMTIFAFPVGGWLCEKLLLEICHNKCSFKGV